MLVVAAFLAVATTEETTQAHDGDHDLALDETGRESLAHWNAGGFDYSIQSTGSNAVPSGWHANIKSAATHLKNSTMLDSVRYQSTLQTSRISVEDWPIGATLGDGSCDEAGTLGGSEVCAFATTASGILDGLVHTGFKDRMSGSRIMFDPEDVYVNGVSGAIRGKWYVVADGAHNINRVSAHELAHAAGFFAHVLGNFNLMHSESPVWNLTVLDKWELNRLYLHSRKGKLFCTKMMDLSGSDFRKAGGVMHLSSVDGDLSQTAPVCPSTKYDGFAYYLYLDHHINGRDFWVWANVNPRPTVPEVKRYMHVGTNPYKQGAEFTGTRRVEQDEIFQLATNKRNVTPRNYQFRIVPDCAYPTNFLFNPGQSAVRRQAYNGKLSSTDSDSDRYDPDCWSAVKDDRYADFYNFYLSSKAFVTIDATSEANAAEGIKIDPLLRLRDKSNTQFGRIRAENDDSNNTTRNAQIKVELESGWYTAEVSSFAANDTGNYSFAILAEGYEFGSAPPSTLAAGTSWSTTLFTAVASNRFTFRLSDRNVITFGRSSSSCPTGAREETGERVVEMPISATLGNNATVSLWACSSGQVALKIYAGRTLLQTFNIEVPSTAPVAVGSIRNLSVSVGSSATVDASDYFTGTTLTYSAASNRTSIATVSVNGADITVRGVAIGSATITITARNTEGTDTQQFTATVVPPGPPTRLRLADVTNQPTQLNLTFRRSETPHYYTFQLYRKNQASGTYSAYGDPVEVTRSPATFSNVPRGHEYRAQGKNCADTDRDDCGNLSSNSNTVELADPETAITELADGLVTNGSDPFRVENTDLVIGKNYTLAMSTSGSGLGFNESCVRSTSQSFRPTARQHDVDLTLYACTGSGGSVSARLRSGGSSGPVADPIPIRCP